MPGSRKHREELIDEEPVPRVGMHPPGPPLGQPSLDAEDAARREPVLAGTIHAMVLGQSTLEGSIAGRIAALVASRESPAHLVISAFEEALSASPSIGVAFRTDMSAFVDRDPATTRLIQVLLYLKGFHALELHRISHWLWTRGRFDLALELQARASEVLQVDIHPAAQLGSGLFLDHSTGIVIGETAIVEDGVSILQGVTLGGTGTAGGRRHPHIRCGVLIGSEAPRSSVPSRSASAPASARGPWSSMMCRQARPWPVSPRGVSAMAHYSPLPRRWTRIFRGSPHRRSIQSPLTGVSLSIEFIDSRF